MHHCCVVKKHEVAHLACHEKTCSLFHTQCALLEMHTMKKMFTVIQIAQNKNVTTSCACASAQQTANAKQMQKDRSRETMHVQRQGLRATDAEAAHGTDISYSILHTHVQTPQSKPFMSATRRQRKQHAHGKSIAWQKVCTKKIASA